jgi:2-oxoglutarate dehydrogenase E2 component (dihydrolipoamide succinyltransferase)
MLVEVVMPKMGESLQEGTILKWLKNVGATVDRDEMILEISTDKVDTEVPSPVAGTITEILAQEGDTVDVGSVIARIETEASSAQPVATPPLTVLVPEPVKEVEVEITKVETPIISGGNLIDVVMPKMGESLQEGTILKWLKNVGATVDRDEMILEISTDKVDTEVPSPVAGTITEILAQEGDTVDVGSVIARISTGTVSIPLSTPSATVAIATEIKNEVKIEEKHIDLPKDTGNRFYSPLVRTIAEKEGISIDELNRINGNGLEGRVTKDDVIKYLSNRSSSPAPAPKIAQVVAPTTVVVNEPVAPKIATPAPTQKSATPISIGPDSEVIPMDRVRQKISEHMVYSKQTSAHVTSVGEADVTNIVKFREKFGKDFLNREGFKLTFTPFFAKAAVDGVKTFPMVNVSVDGKNIIKHRRINLSFATALDDGNLIVPVIKSADALTVSGLARSVYDLSTRARSKKLNPDDIQGGTFCITNVGTFGTLFGTPVINQPQTAIMGIGAIQKRPVVREFNGEHIIVIRDMAYVSLTYDHRVIDGMLAGQCLAAIIKSLESMNEDTISL